MYTEFTGLKTANLKTWIAIGGFDFSDANATTHTTWSDMVSSTSSRSAFISSLKSFMDRYGFQGVDLDWEYPGSETRGGKRADTENFVSLVREMRSAYGSAYGISLTLAPDYWYLRYFDAIAMEPYVDWFGFMS
jgi:chitinase